jgi:uncharacterized protein (TIGR00251 family)
MPQNKIFQNTNDGLIIRLKIIPNSSKNDIILENGILKIKLTAQPIENKANKALIEMLSKKLKIAKSNIKIIKGELNKEKTLLIKGIDEEMFFRYMNIVF